MEVAIHEHHILKADWSTIVFNGGVAHDYVLHELSIQHYDVRLAFDYQILHAAAGRVWLGKL